MPQIQPRTTKTSFLSSLKEAENCSLSFAMGVRPFLRQNRDLYHYKDARLKRILLLFMMKMMHKKIGGGGDRLNNVGNDFLSNWSSSRWFWFSLILSLAAAFWSWSWSWLRLSGSSWNIEVNINRSLDYVCPDRWGFDIIAGSVLFWCFLSGCCTVALIRLAAFISFEGLLLI